MLSQNFLTIDNKQSLFYGLFNLNYALNLLYLFFVCQNALTDRVTVDETSQLLDAWCFAFNLEKIWKFFLNQNYLIVVWRACNLNLSETLKAFYNFKVKPVF